MKTIYFFAALVLACVLKPAPALAAPFEERLQRTLARALPRLGCNLSPREPKPVWREEKGERRRELRWPAPGSVAASPSLDQPDYYFHWVRDSSLAVEPLARLLPRMEGGAEALRLRAFLSDYVRFSAGLQAAGSPFGPGDPRFNLDGSVDDISWSRPQHDGPGLRVLTLLRLLEEGDELLGREVAGLARETLLRDLEHLSSAFEAKSYDLWEYSFGHHLYARLVQLGAFEAALRYQPAWRNRDFTRALRGLREVLPRHWRQEDGFYHFSLGSVAGPGGEEVPEVGGGLDASTVLAVNHAGRGEEEFSARDPKLLGTAFRLEAYFKEAYPLNRRHPFGPAIGRHPGDDYYGGNPWVVLTAGFAELQYRLARELAKNPDRSWRVTPASQAYLAELLGRPLPVGTEVAQNEELRRALIARLLAKGDAFLDTVMDSAGADGVMAEQFDKGDGRPTGARDLTWSYSSFLSAVLARESAAPSAIPYRELSLACLK